MFSRQLFASILILFLFETLAFSIFRHSPLNTAKRHQQHVQRYCKTPLQESPPHSLLCTRSTLFQGADNDEYGFTTSEQTVYELLTELHTAQLAFRLVVIGNGAILETTSELGPTFKVNQSPKTKENLTTFASVDQSFEFHLKIAQVKKIVLSSKTSPRPMQIFRFLSTEDKPMCSLILADKSDEAQTWFQTMLEKYGGEIQP